MTLLPPFDEQAIVALSLVLNQPRLAEKKIEICNQGSPVNITPIDSWEIRTSGADVLLSAYDAGIWQKCLHTACTNKDGLSNEVRFMSEVAILRDLIEETFMNTHTIVVVTPHVHVFVRGQERPLWYATTPNGMWIVSDVTTDIGCQKNIIDQMFFFLDLRTSGAVTFDLHHAKSKKQLN